MNRVILVLFIIALSSCKPYSEAKKESDTIEKSSTALLYKLTQRLDSTENHGSIKGFSVVMVNQDSILYNRGFGYADVDNKIKYTDSTIQNIASISKTLIGIALLKAQELGKLKLDDPIHDYLPFDVVNPFFPNEKITIRHLATHTSTILDTDIYDEKSYVYMKGEPSSGNGLSRKSLYPKRNIPLIDYQKEVLSKEGKWYLENGFSNNKPGQLYQYSNTAAALAAAIIEIASGVTYVDFTKQYILRPLGMQHTGWSFDDIDVSKHSMLYTENGEIMPFYTLLTYPDGGLITSSHDLGLYIRELIRGFSGSGTLLEPESYQELFREQLTALNFKNRTTQDFNEEYNYGIFMGFTPNGYIGHTGGDPGVSSYMFFDPLTSVGRILVVNTDLDDNGRKQFKGIWKILGEYQNQQDE